MRLRIQAVRRPKSSLPLGSRAEDEVQLQQKDRDRRLHSVLLLNQNKSPAIQPRSRSAQTQERTSLSKARQFRHHNRQISR